MQFSRQGGRLCSTKDVDISRAAKLGKHSSKKAEPLQRMSCHNPDDAPWLYGHAASSRLPIQKGFPRTGMQYSNRDGTCELDAALFYSGTILQGFHCEHKSVLIDAPTAVKAHRRVIEQAQPHWCVKRFSIHAMK